MPTEDDDVIEIKQEPRVPDTQDLSTGGVQHEHSSQPETFSTSQIPVDHEEVVAAQDPFDQPQEEIEDWSTILSRGKQQEK